VVQIAEIKLSTTGGPPIRQLCHSSACYDTIECAWKQALTHEPGRLRFRFSTARRMNDLMHMAQQAAADKPKPSLPPGPKATTGDIVRPLAAAKGAMEAVDAHVDQTGAPGTHATLPLPFVLGCNPLCAAIGQGSIHFDSSVVAGNQWLRISASHYGVFDCP